MIIPENIKGKNEKWIAKNYPIFHSFILNRYQEYEIPWAAKLYLYKNNMDNPPICYCGKEIKFYRGKFRKYCSTKCLSNDPFIKEKSRNTNLVKYGAPIALASDEYKYKVGKILIKKYGFDNASKSEVIKEKVRQTNQKKIGHDYYSQLQKTKEYDYI